MKPIEGHARTVRQLLDGMRYGIDFYQREYAWKDRQVRELVDDLTSSFFEDYHDTHQRREVEGYGHYFLGPIVTSSKGSQKFLVDGQQRLTSLTLLLIHLEHLRGDREDTESLATLIFSARYGDKSFNLDVPDREETMNALLKGASFDPDGRPDSVRNLVERFATLQECFPDELHLRPLPFFVDWLRDHVHLVEIEARSEEDAYTIFETMNDRGLSLSLPDMLKGYILSHIGKVEEQKAVNARWQELVRELRQAGSEADTDFFKNWLRGRHARTIREHRSGSVPRDYERIGSEFHRWVRDNREVLGLVDSPAFVAFVRRDMDFYARQAVRIHEATRSIRRGWESVYYNAERGFTLQTQLLLAPLSPDEPADVTERKIGLVADYLDIWLARRVWNFRTSSPDPVLTAA